MKIIKRIIQILLVVVILIFIAGFFGVRYISNRSVPDYSTDVNLKGLSADVEVFRDKYGIPHVYAKTEKDLYTAVGFLMAQDRLWQMDLLRRITLGRLSEIFGARYADTDLLLRALRYTDKSKYLLDETDPVIIDALKAFSDGVNEYIEANERKLPPEFTILGYKPEPWEPFHSLNLIGYMAWDLKAGWSELLLEKIRQVVDSTHMKELLPDKSGYRSLVYPDFKLSGRKPNLITDLTQITDELDKLGIEIFDGSNNWAISGIKSATGNLVLANDMHISLNVPGIWYQMHQVIKGKLDVTGVVLPGQPLIICGHNDRIAWGMTNTYVDNMDFYLEKINPEDSNQYLYNGKWQNFSSKTELIATRKGDTLIRVLRFNHRGPVVSQFKHVENDIVTMHWVGDEYSNEMRTVYFLNRAGDWDQFTDALKTFRSISQNIVYADKDGNIGLFCAAGIPVRKRSGYTGMLPGWTDEYDWKGMVPFEDLPYSYNPECGYVSSANNRTVGDDYPYHIGSWYALPYRINRIRDLLGAKEKLTVNDFKEIQLDQKSEMAVHYKPVFLKALKKTEGLSDLQRQCFQIIDSWDGRMGKDSPAAAIFEIWYLKLRQNLFADDLGKELFGELNRVSTIIRPAVDRIIESGQSVWADDINTGKVESLSDILIKSFQDAVNELENSLGHDPLEWKWGDIHKITFTHLLASKKNLDRIFSLNRGPYRVGGSFHTVSPYTYPADDPSEVNHGSSHRHIYTPDNWDSSLTIIPTGNSGIPAAKNYCDQTEMYINGLYHKDLYSTEAVKSGTVDHMFFRAVNSKQ